AALRLRALRLRTLRRRPGRGRLRLRLRRVVAVLHHVALGAVGLVLVVLLEVAHEAVERLLLLLRLEDVLDRGGGLRERLLRGRVVLRDLEDVVAELRLDRALDLTGLRAEDRGVERLLLLALRHTLQLAALRLRRLVG